MHRSGHFIGNRLYFNHKLYFHYMGAERIVRLAEVCEESQADRVAIRASAGEKRGPAVL